MFFDLDQQTSRHQLPGEKTASPNLTCVNDRIGGRRLMNGSMKESAMPWTVLRYPRSMANLPEGVRTKAIAIANALLEEGCEEGRAIRIAIVQAKRWAAAHRVRRAQPG